MIPKRAGSFLILLPVFLSAQLQIPAPSLHQAAQLPISQRTPASPRRPSPFKSPVMQRMWAEEHSHHLATANKPSVLAASPFLTTPPMYAAGSNPFDLALGDFNSDGKPDVIVAANPPVLLLGNGDGTLQAAVSIGTIPSNPTGVAVGDFNRDGNLDVVFAVSGGAIVYLGNGSGAFGAGFAVSSGNTNQNVFARVLVADVNHDGLADLILNTDAGISALLGNGNGNFRAPITSSGTVQFMSVADFNKDGNADLAVTNGYNSLNIMLGNGAGAFVVASSYSPTEQNLNAVAIADFNQDGFPDAALPNGQVFLGNGDGTLKAPADFQTVVHAVVAAAVDVNGDGIPDLVTVSSGAPCGQNDFGTTGVSLGKGDGTFQPVGVVDSGGCSYPAFLAIGDLNNDGAADIAVLTGSSGVFTSTPELSVLVNKGNGTFPGAELSVSGGSGGVTLADFNHDGNADVALADGSVYLGNGDGTLNFKASASLAGVAIATGDFNHDGIPDLAAAVECSPAGCSSGGQLLIALGNGDGTFHVPTVLPSGGFYAESLVVADFNSDGNLDIAIVNNCRDTSCSTGGSVSIYLGNGRGTFTLLNTMNTPPGNPTSVVAGDFNNDGVLDLVVGLTASFNPSPINVFLGNGDGSFQSPIVSYAPDQWGISAMVAADLNSDGILDVALAEGGCSDCGQRGGIMYGNGDGTFTTGPDIGEDGAPEDSVVAADFYGMGTPIPVLSNRCGDSLDCPGGSVIITGNLNPSDIMLAFLAVGDFNNDGKPDLVGSLQYDAGASVLLNIGATLAATTTTVSPASVQSYSAFQPATFTAQIQHTGPGTPTGTVQFLDSGVSVGSASLKSSGEGSLTTSNLAVGAHFVVAYYQGDTGFAPSNALGVHITINKESMALALCSSVNPSALGQSVTFTATITSQFSGQATGSITFSDGSTVLGSAAVSANMASLTTSGFAIGTHSITATYSGDSNFTASTSTPLLQLVTKATTTTVLLSSLNPSLQGKSVTFTATVSSLAGTPTGRVEYLNGTTVLATVTLSSGSAKVTTSKLPPGATTITAVYEGDSNNAGSTSLPVSQFVVAASATTLTSSPNPSIYGQSVLFNAVVTSSIGSPPDGETVTFRVGATVLGTGSLSGGTAKFSSSILPVGTKAVTAVYGGDSNFSSSSSRAVSQVICKATSTTTVISSLNPSNPGESVTFTATVVGQFGGTVTGSITFLYGTAKLKVVSLSGGTAKFTTRIPASGTYNITATYSGSLDFVTSAATFTQTVN
jgi:Bacterial Ig-like domain (group 3)/FG-GAP-like repeat